MKFYEDQHKLAAYLERTGAEWEEGFNCNLFFVKPQRTLQECLNEERKIRPVLRYGLPSHLQSEIHNPDNLTEEQICEGGKYRAWTEIELNKALSYGQRMPEMELWERSVQGWVKSTLGGYWGDDGSSTYRLPADVPWPDWEAGPHVTQDDVHTSHCCKDHGCKYGEDACPVVTGRLKQEYPCEDCSTEPDPKDARIAELENLLKVPEGLTHYVKELEAQLSASPWRRMSEVPTEEDADEDKCVPVMDAFGNLSLLRIYVWEHSNSLKGIVAWMPVPKFHGWPDPLADLLKTHGVEATPELTAALNAWKGAEK